eukprot:1691221-Prymnesium_polylepis.1
MPPLAAPPPPLSLLPPPGDSGVAADFSGALVSPACLPSPMGVSTSGPAPSRPACLLRATLLHRASAYSA